MSREPAISKNNPEFGSSVKRTLKTAERKNSINSERDTKRKVVRSYPRLGTSSMLAFVFLYHVKTGCRIVVALKKLKRRCREEVQYAHESQGRGMKGRKERQVGASITVEVPRTLGVHGPLTRFRGKASGVLSDPHSIQGCFIPYRLPFPSSQ